MLHLLATKEGGFILGPISTVLGWIMDGIFKATDLFGIMNIGLSIILFTVVIKLLMAPMTVKQQKFSRMNSYMAPEIQAIQAKYKGKSDQESMMRQNMEMQDVYAKYGVKPTAGCLQLIIQMPILFALYRVVWNIPAYVSSVKMYYSQIVDQLIKIVPNYQSNEILQNLMKGTRITELDTTDKIIDMMYSFDASKWQTLQESFPALNITEQVSKIESMNSFMGISLFNAPSSYITNFQGILPLIVALMIPILAGLSQWISVKVSTAQTEKQKKKLGKEEEPSAMESSMKMMTNIMPIMSVVFCFTLSSCIGVYWVISSVAQVIMQVFVNKHMDKMDVNDIVKKNMEKINEKRAKQGLPPQRITNVANQRTSSNNNSNSEAKAEKRKENIKKSTDYYNNSSSYKPGSLAAKANMVKQYDDKKSKK